MITNSSIVLRKTATQLLNKLYKTKILYRSVGIELKKLSYNEEKQQSLFGDIKQEDDKLSRTLDCLEEKFGRDIIKLGV